MGSPNRIGLLLIAAILVTLVLGACSGAPTPQAPAKEQKAETIVWPMHQHNAAYGPGWKTYQYFAAQVAYRTNGRLKIELNPGGALGFKGTEVLRILKDGTVPIAEVSWPYHVGEIAAVGVFDMPFVTPAAIDGWNRFFEAAMSALSKELQEKWGLVPLFSVAWPGSSYYTSKPVAKLEDFKGLMIRTYSAETAEIVTAFGASPVSIPIGEVYTALQRNTVSGVHTGSSAVIGNKLYEVAKYYNRWDTHTSHSTVAVNQAAFDALPADIRAAVLEAAKEAQQTGLTISNGTWSEDIGELKSKGAIEVAVPPEEREKARKLAIPVWERWADRSGPLARQAFDAAKKATGY